MKVFMFSSYPRISFYGANINDNKNRPNQFGNIMYDKRVVRGNTWALRKMAEVDELKLAHEDQINTKKKTKAPQQGQKQLKSRLRKVAAIKDSANGSVPSSDDKTVSESYQQNFDHTPHSDAGVQIADDELLEDAVLNALVEQTIRVAVDELVEEMKLKPQSVQTSDAFTTTSRLSTTTSKAAAAQTDLLNENVGNRLNTSYYDKQLKDQLRQYSHTLITNMINDCSAFVDEKTVGDDIKDFVMQGLCPLAITMAEAIGKGETWKNRVLEEFFLSSGRE